MSVAGVAGAPFHCSGAMYSGVPAAGAFFPAFTATPKSVSLLSPTPSTSTFSGL
jgi:hypothetical protein